MSWFATFSRPELSSTELRQTIWLQDFSACVVAPRGVLQELRRLFPRSRVTTPERLDSSPAIRLAVRPHPSSSDRYQLTRDDAVLWETADKDEVLPLLEWAIASACVEHLGRRYLLFHAGAVALNGRGILLPGCSGSGKSTLVAGLLGANFKYLTDEVAVIEPETGMLRAFPKSVCVKEGSRQTLSRMYPQLARARWRHRFGPELVAFLPPPSASWSTEHVPVRFVIIPKYIAGSGTRLEPLARSTAAAVLLEQSFNARALGLGGVMRALDLLRGADCFALTTGDLQPAVRLIRELAATR